MILPLRTRERHLVLGANAQRFSWPSYYRLPASFLFFALAVLLELQASCLTYLLNVFVCEEITLFVTTKLKSKIIFSRARLPNDQRTLPWSRERDIQLPATSIGNFPTLPRGSVCRTNQHKKHASIDKTLWTMAAAVVPRPLWCPTPGSDAQKH